RRAITSSLPLSGDDGLPANSLDYLLENIAKFCSVRLDWDECFIVICGYVDGVRRRLGLRRNQHRRNRQMMTGLMKILEVKCVIAYLICCRRREFAFVHLELKHEDDALNDSDDIDATA